MQDHGFCENHPFRFFNRTFVILYANFDVLDTKKLFVILAR
jgi:hypothetical protein